MNQMFSTKELAHYLGINEKMVYSLVSEKGLPATKITGKWIFPKYLVDQWIESSVVNFPKGSKHLSQKKEIVIISGSNDILLDKTIALFNKTWPELLAVFGNIGSMGGIMALKKNLCHIASSHLLEKSKADYNFDYIGKELTDIPVVVNFCMRYQGFILKKGNPKNIRDIKDLFRPRIRMVNRPLGTGTRLLFDTLLSSTGLKGEKISGYYSECLSHMDAGIEVLTGKADVAPSIEPVASLLGLDFVPIQQERYDLVIKRELFFEKSVQYFIGLLNDEAFRQMGTAIKGYDVSLSGKILFQNEIEPA